jgi:hypothetical protein
MEQKEHNVEFFISNIGGKDSSEVIDLNKMFQMNFSYNFDLLKNLIEALLKNQKNFRTELKEKTMQFVELENKVLDLQLASSNQETPSPPTKPRPSFQQLEINTGTSINMSPKLLSVIKGDSNIIKLPPNDIQLEESTANDEKMNNVIVSKLNIINIYIFSPLEKNKWYK